MDMTGRMDPRILEERDKCFNDHYRNDMSPEDRYREDRTRHMIHGNNAEQQKEDIRWNHSLKTEFMKDPLSYNEHGGY